MGEATNELFELLDYFDIDQVICRLLVQQPDPCPVPDERKARPRSRDQLCLGGDEDVPFPGRAYFYRDDTLSYTEWMEEYRDSDPSWLTA